MIKYLMTFGLNKLVVFLAFVCPCVLFGKKVIWDERIGLNELEQRVRRFNEWYRSIDEGIPLELKVNPIGESYRLSVHATREIKENEPLIEFSEDTMITAKSVYNTKYAEFLKQTEEMYGYDDMLNFLIYILSEFYEPNSKWSAYFDLVPRQPSNLAHDYWNQSKRIEDEIKEYSIASNQY